MLYGLIHVSRANLWPLVRPVAAGGWAGGELGVCPLQSIDESKSREKSLPQNTQNHISIFDSRLALRRMDAETAAAAAACARFLQVTAGAGVTDGSQPANDHHRRLGTLDSTAPAPTGDDVDQR